MDEIAETDYEVAFDPKTMKFKEKVAWTFKLWFGFKTRLKTKVKKVE